MNPIAHKIGGWHYGDGFRKDMQFEGGRTMIVVAASAYNANGLIGSEYNGLVVIDADNNGIVLKNHLRSGSGSSGPNREQQAEFERVTSLGSWPEFTSWLRSAPNFRGGVPDIDQQKPTAPSEASIVVKAAANRTVPGLPGASILPQAYLEAHDNPELPYSYPHRTRLDMAAAIAGHAMRKEHYQDAYLAWDIKVHSYDESGRIENGETVDPDLDALWAKYWERNGDSLFWEICRDATRTYVDDEATTYPGDNQGDLSFEIQGRSSGWLVLKEFRGTDLGFDSHLDLVEKLLDMDEADLAELYAAIVSLDADIKPEQELAFHLNSMRARKEEDDWSTPEAAEAAAAELGLEDWTHPARNSGPRPA